ncbi:hypothetical protein [Clostridium novyi]|uniref:hypothetical protein n=1 Tax=Clostridium novyi TaxID=1542 RepID=UPI0012D31D53|nr:hypothetical protein [Clostridium novyi]
MMNWLDYFKGRKYGIATVSKALNDNGCWYCSLLPWKGYKTTFGVDIDADGGPKVAPDDIINYKPSTIIATSK